MTRDDICFQPGPDLLPVVEARRRILAAAGPVTGTEMVDLRAGLGRVLAQTVAAAEPVPGFDNSAMDGYGLRTADAGEPLRVVGRSLAGNPYAGTIGPGEAVRIMTGAPIPEGVDTVVMQEHVTADETTVHIDKQPTEGDNIRRAGEDLTAGETVLEPGRRLRPADLGLLASVGVSQVRVHRRPRVAFFSTGDELRGVGEPLEHGTIRDSNRYTLHALLERAGVEVHDLGVVRDDLAATETALAEASAMADAVITTGGASVGTADHIHTALANRGEVAFWRIAMKPGKPLAFGRVGDALFFGLPGNPVSAMATFLQFVAPALAVQAGEPAAEPRTLRLPVAEPFTKAAGRTEFQRGLLEPTADGGLAVRPTGPQGSHILRSMSLADCLVILPAESEGASPGELVEVQPLTTDA